MNSHGRLLQALLVVLSSTGACLPIAACSPGNIASTDDGLPDGAADDGRIERSDPEDPRLAITSPADGAQFLTPMITISGTASDNEEVVSVSVKVGSGDWLAATGTLSWSTKVTLIPGLNTITAAAYDAAGNHAEASVTVSLVDQISPTVVIVSPAPGSTVGISPIELCGTASDQIALSKVEIRIGTGEFAPATGTTAWSHQLTLSEGLNTVTARATDTAGNTAEVSAALNYVPGVVPAFPEAQGPGATSRGGRGGRVIEVTNLEDSGPGSLRAALEATAARIVVFRVAGIITLKRSPEYPEGFMRIAGDVTVAGQTAPGGGITVRGRVVLSRADNVILRFLALRPGKSAAYPTKAEFTGYENYNWSEPLLDDALSIWGGNNILLDHLSISWANDENVEIWNDAERSTSNVTFSWSLIAEGLQPHSCGMIFGAPNDDLVGAANAHDIAIHHNLIYHNLNRMPLVLIRDVVLANNLINHAGWRVTMLHGGVQADILSNIYTLDPPPSDANREVFPLSRDQAGQGPPGSPSIYIAGNTGPSQSDPNGDNWAMVGTHSGTTRRESPLPPPPIPIVLDPVDALEELVLEDVGNSRRLDANGDWVRRRDSVDARLAREYREGSPVIPWDEEDVGGFPTLDSGVPYDDSDHDGMPDAWETRHNFSPSDPNDGNLDADGDGYTNIEEFINGTLPRSRG